MAVKYNNAEYDDGFVDFLGEKLGSWAKHQGLNDALIAALLQVHSNRAANMRNGVDGRNNTGVDKVYLGKHTGEVKDGPTAWNGTNRISFDAESNYDAFVNGIAGRYNRVYGNKTTSKKSNSKSWTKHTGQGASTLGGRLTNLWGNSTDMSQWADAVGDKIGEDGKRTQSNRYNSINEILSQYSKDIENGVYGDMNENEDLRSEYNLVNGALQGDLNGGREYAYRKLFGDSAFDRLMFTGNKYQTAEEVETEKNKTESKNRADAALAYINGTDPNAKNPYDQNSTDEAERKLYEETEHLRNMKAEERDFETFKSGKLWTDFADRNLYSTIATNVNQNAFENMNLSDLNTWARDGAGAGMDREGYNSEKSAWNIFGHTGEWFDADGEADDGVNLTDILGQDYIKAVGVVDLAPNDNSKEIWFDRRKRNSYAARAKAAVDRAMAFRGTTGYQLEDGSYIYPELIDWDKGDVISYNFNPENGGIIGSTKSRSLNNVIQSIAKRNPEYAKQLYKAYVNHKKGIRSNKEGGVLYAAGGAPISADEVNTLLNNRTTNSTFKPKSILDDVPDLPSIKSKTAVEKNTEMLDTRDQEFEQIGGKELGRKDLKNSTTFTATDYARLGTAVADITGAVLSLSGVGSVAGGAVGAASTLTLFGLDVADGSVGWGQALAGLGVGLALDAFTLIPEAGAMGGIAKAAKTISKLAIPIASALQVAGNSEESLATLKKITQGDFKNITVGEWRGFCSALNGITNATNVGKLAYDKRLGKLSNLNKSVKEIDAATGELKTAKEFELGIPGTDLKFKITSKDIADINAVGKSEGQERALALLQERAKLPEGVDKTKITADGLFKFGSKDSKSSLLGKAKGVFTKEQLFNPEGGTSVLGEAGAEQAYAESMIGKLKDPNSAYSRYVNELKRWKADKDSRTGFNKWITDKVGTDAEYIAGGKGSLNKRLQFVNDAINAEKTAANTNLINTLRSEIDGMTPLERDVDVTATKLRELEALNRERKLAKQKANNAYTKAVDDLTSTKINADALDTKYRLTQQELIKQGVNFTDSSRELGILEKDITKASSKLDKLTALLDKAANAKKPNKARITALKDQIRQQRKELNKLNRAQQKHQSVIDRYNLLKEGTTEEARLAGQRMRDKALADFDKANLDRSQTGKNYREALRQLRDMQARMTKQQADKTDAEQVMRLYRADVASGVRLPKTYNTRELSAIELLNPNARIKGVGMGDVAADRYVNWFNGTPIDANNMPRFQKFIGDAKTEGLTDINLKRLLRDSEKMKRIRTLYGFKHGGQIQKMSNGSTIYNDPILTKENTFRNLKFGISQAANRKNLDLSESKPVLLFDNYNLNPGKVTGNSVIQLTYTKAGNDAYTLGEKAAEGTSDLNQAYLYRKNALDTKLGYDLKGNEAYSNSITASEDKVQARNDKNYDANYQYSLKNKELRTVNEISKIADKQAYNVNNAAEWNKKFAEDEDYWARIDQANKLSAQAAALNDNRDYQIYRDEIAKLESDLQNNPDDETLIALLKLKKLDLTNFKKNWLLEYNAAHPSIEGTNGVRLYLTEEQPLPYLSLSKGGNITVEQEKNKAKDADRKLKAMLFYMSLNRKNLAKKDSLYEQYLKMLASK